MKKIFLVLIYLVAWSGFIHAQPVDHLYIAEVPVKSRSDADRNLALRQALNQVLIKTVGNRAVLARFQQAYAAQKIDLMAWVLSYAYQRSSPEVTGYSGETLRVDFLPERIDAVLSKVGIGRWTSNRPLILVWIAQQQNAMQQLVNAENAPQLCEIIEYMAWQRGIPVLFPVLDIDDLRALPANALNTASYEQVTQATARYTPDLVLTLSLRPAAQGWQADWQLFQADHPLRWSHSAENLPELIRTGMDNFADTLAAQYVRQNEAPLESFELVVENLKHFTDYARIYDYLQQLDMVTHLELLEMEPGTARYHITARGGVQGFARNVIAGQILQADGEASQQRAVYRLVR